MQYKSYTGVTNRTQVKNLDFDNSDSENIFRYPHMAKKEGQFHSENYLLEMLFSHVKMHLESASQELKFAMAEALSKTYTLDCSCKCPYMFPHSYA